MSSLYPFQEKAVLSLTEFGKHILFATMGAGKTAISMSWAERMCAKTGKKKVLVVTTASKCRAKNLEGDDDFSADAKTFCSPSFYKSLSSSLTLLSWHRLAKWTADNLGEIDDYVIVFDELQRGSGGASSQMGKAFLKITKKNQDWAGFTGTPGDTWLKFYPYFVACGLVRNKTSFLARYANVQTYKGYPEIVGWRNEEELKQMWDRISYSPDTSQVMAELPPETHKVVLFDKPKGYDKVLKTHYKAGSDGKNLDDFLDTPGALCAELRRLCFTKEKQEWVSDFASGLESGCVFFYNFIQTGDMLEEIIKKALPKGTKVWRIDGKHHEIPTAKTMGERDMVLCQWQSGAEGLNLQHLHYWCSVEACYSYSTSIQARGRIKRIGQEEPMTFFYVKTVGTIEDVIYGCLKNKSDFATDTWCRSEGIVFNE